MNNSVVSLHASPARCTNSLAALLSLVVTIAVVTASASAQSSEEVHLVPRVRQEAHAPDKLFADASLMTATPPVRVNVNLVLVPVTVTDERNRLVSTLGRGDFELFEEEQPQEIRYFSVEDAPISIGLVVDLSGSMAKKLDSVHAAVDEFFANANPQDDYFVVTVSDTPRVLATRTQSVGTIQAKLASSPAGGITPLLDAIYLAETKLHSARYQRKAILIISDGADNASRYSLKEIKSLVQERDVEIYAIGLFDGLPLVRRFEEKFGKHLLNEVTEATGGRTIGIDNIAKLPAAAAVVSRELRSRYVLGYLPNARTVSRPWRKIKVKVRAQENAARVQAYYKKGYSYGSE